MPTYNTYMISFTHLSSAFLTSGSYPSEKCGTRSQMSNPSLMSIQYTSDVKAIWRYSINKSPNMARGIVTLSVTPPVDAPLGKYSLSAETKTGKTTLGTLVVLFNPWCSGGCRYWNPDEKKRKNTWLRCSTTDVKHIHLEVFTGPLHSEELMDGSGSFHTAAGVGVIFLLKSVRVAIFKKMNLCMSGSGRSISDWTKASTSKT